MQELLIKPDREIETTTDPEQALARCRAKPFDLVITDLKLNARLDGIDVLRGVREATPSTPVIIVTGFGELEKAVEAVREGAFDFVSKPFNITELKALVERALHKSPAAPPPVAVRDTMPPALLGRTPAMTAVYKQIAHAASADAPVLIIGESGTGKELVARAIHQHGNRSARPFVPINCGALTETLLESELFGHIKGSFTGAVSDSKGVFQTAHTGTVFLDEVGEMSPALQVKLLRVLQEGEVRAGRHQPHRQGRRAHRRRNQRRRRTGRRRGQVPAGPVLPAGRRDHQLAAAARAPRRHPAADRALPESGLVKGRASRSS